ncbi:MAG TPA: hypothetical protein VMZ26_18235 [Pyrinomonadaceae bacterium]|nr:hypothetical protein [Pyrinomonadaceae bacterium]
MLFQAVVKGKEKGGRQWEKNADVISISLTGSSFNVTHKCEVGTLVTLAAALPAHLRFYDYDKEIYRVWGLVQYCEPTITEDSPSFHIGIAFIGKDCPQSYKADPRQHYRISGVGHDGMWNVAEMERPFKKRTGVRFWRNIDLYLAVISSKEGVTGGERATSENVSRNGAAVLTTLNLVVGDRVKFISERYDFSGLAVVCNVQRGDDARTRLHLKFVENTFPVETLMKSAAALERI